MSFNTKTFGGGLLALDRRMFVGALGLSAGATAIGGLACVTQAAAAVRPTAAVHMDMPFVDRSGTHRPYRPPLANYASIELGPEHHLFV